MTVDEMFALRGSVPAGSGSLPVAVKCPFCECEIFLGSGFSVQAEADPEIPIDRPGNVPRLVFPPE